MRQPPLPNSGSANEHAATMKRLRSLSHILDKAITIPGTSISIGLDPILGLLPVAGDYLGTFLSAYIVLQAGMLGLPRETLVRMVVNIVFDSLVGTIPFLGDLFDVGFKANTKNVELLEAHLASPRPSKQADKWFLAALLVGLLVAVVAITALTFFIVGSIWQIITGK